MGLHYPFVLNSEAPHLRERYLRRAARARLPLPRRSAQAIVAPALEVGQSLFGTADDDVRCLLKVSGVDDAALRVASYETREKLSNLFFYEIELATDPNDVAKIEEALGAEASFAIQRDGATERIVHGIVTEVVPDGSFVGTRQARTLVVVEPRLANLRYSGGFRIFQEKSARDIITALVAPERIDVAFRLRGDLPIREYRTQLDESDLEFLQRLAADEGLHYFFSHDAAKTTRCTSVAMRSSRSLSPRQRGGERETPCARIQQRRASSSSSISTAARGSPRSAARERAPPARWVAMP